MTASRPGDPADTPPGRPAPGIDAPTTPVDTGARGSGRSEESSNETQGLLGATASPGSPSVPGTGSQPVPDEAARDRGRLDIALAVVRKIAEHAADVTEGTTTMKRKLAGVGLGESGSTARVSGYGDQVDLRLELPLAYPAPITTTVEAVRGNVRDRVQSLTGYRVRSLDVTVSALTSPTTGPTRTGRTE